MKLRLIGQHNDVTFIDAPEDFELPKRIKCSYPNIRLIWGHYVLVSANLRTYRWFENCAPPDKDKIINATPVS